MTATIPWDWYVDPAVARLEQRAIPEELRFPQGAAGTQPPLRLAPRPREPLPGLRRTRRVHELLHALHVDPAQTSFSLDEGHEEPTDMATQLRHPIHDRIVGTGLETIKGIPRVIGVAGGKEKVAVIRAALCGGLINVLVTDDQTAAQLLDASGTNTN